MRARGTIGMEAPLPDLREASSPVGPREGSLMTSPDGAFLIVGVGASAGGLEAFTTLLHHLGTGSGLAIVLIQHLDPTHTSLLREALVKTTPMTVVHAEDGMRVAPEHVYVIQPNTWLGIRDGLFTLSERSDTPRGPHLPVDLFLRALAEERGRGAVGVVLSGTASDGTEGLRAIKQAGGITFVQDPASAKFCGMPESALEADVVDASLPLPELAAELVRLSHHPCLVAPTVGPPRVDAATLKEIFACVERATRVDFSEYRLPTLERRIARRMALRDVTTLTEYLTVLRQVPEEAAAFCEEALIRVTSFFRDPEVFESLTANVFPVLVENKPERAPIRAWVAGCATGEEAYSLGIALVEFLGGSSRPIQIFGSDVSNKSIQVARAGIYPDSALRDLSQERRSRFFTKVERGYRVCSAIRNLCTFVQHDLARDPPFSRLDIASCRNVLIYFGEALQQRVLPTLHYALGRPGFLLLGRTKSLAGLKPLFETVDAANRVFARSDVPGTLRFAARSEERPSSVLLPSSARRRSELQGDLSRRIDQLLLTRYAPPGVVVNETLDILQFRGDTGAYLRPAPGEPQINLMQMVRDGLAMTVRAAVAEARSERTPVRARGVEVAQDGPSKTCDVQVIPLMGLPGADGDLYLILFEETGRARGRKPPPRPTSTKGEAHISKLEHELVATKEYLQTVIAEHARANEGLGWANEALVSGNEELQSMNEELETAKEELQSLNEELVTVNDELEGRNREVVQTNTDLMNVLTAVDIPILILDAERRIRRFTPKARRILNVLPTDIGRAFGDIKPNLDVPNLDMQVAVVIETMTLRESEVQDDEGRWHRLQIRPYQTADHRIDGAVLSLVDIDALKHNVTDARRATSDSDHANQMKDNFLATLSHELRTPLSSILMRAQQLRGGAIDDAKVRRAGESIEAGVKRQVQLIDDLLDISRITAGKLKMDMRPVDLAHVVTTAVEGLRLAAKRRSLTLDLRVDDGESTAQVVGDDSRLQQVATNLVANAIKFTPERGTVTVSLAIGTEAAVLRVSDTGVGIAPEFLPYVFDRFSQEGDTSTRTFGGLGLGLAIVRHIVDLHRGTAVVESPGKGQGATFSVSLPLTITLVPVALTSVSNRGPEPADVARLAGLRVLVVDDDLATREVVADILGRTGAIVRLAASSAEALQAVPDFRPELIVSDIAMPGEDGYAFIRKLRALGVAGSGAVPVLALTALAHEEDRRRTLAAGFKMHIAKPVGIDQLTQAVVELTRDRAGAPPGPA